MKKLYLSLLLLITVTAALLLGGCSSKKENSDTGSSTSEKTVIKIAYLPLTHALPLFEEAELLKDSADSNIELELVKFGSWPELLDALKAGRVDGASVLIELAMKTKEQGIGLKAVALGHRDGNAIIVANDINSVADLKGKKFAIPSTQSSHNILLNEMLTSNGLTTDDIEVIEMAPAEMPSALSGGQISGYCVAEPFGAKAVNLGIGKVLYQAGDLWEDSLCCGLVLTDDFINNNKAAADSFIGEYLAAGNQLDLDTAKKVAGEYLGQEYAVLDLSLEWISYKDLTITKDIYSSLADKVVKYKLSDSTPTYEDFIYQP
jgi:NitT/TauT family transport system substrate-binding protein